jgi:hypothetical protein
MRRLPSDELLEEARRLDREHGGRFDRERGELISKAYSLKAEAHRLGRSGAFDDLNAVGFFHVRP